MIDPEVAFAALPICAVYLMTTGFIRLPVIEDVVKDDVKSSLKELSNSAGYAAPLILETFIKLETFKVDGEMYDLFALSLISSTARILDGAKYELPPSPICTTPDVFNEIAAALFTCRADPE